MSFPDADSSVTEIRYVELYAGIGGWRQALESCCGSGQPSLLARLRCVAALDHSDVCRAVYRHNWPAGNDHSELFEIRPIEVVATQAKWDEWNADLVVMSPPCQPHTRQHDHQEADLQDPRSASFLHICRLLKQQEGRRLPVLLMLENVVGFESSRSFQCWLDAIAPHYHVAQFHLDPTQVGVPNDRPRFYCVAVRADRFLPVDSGHNATEDVDWIRKYFVNPSDNNSSTANSQHHRHPLHTCIPELGVTAAPVAEDMLPSLKDVLGLVNNNSGAGQPELHLSRASLQKPASWCLDVVGMDSRRTSCFTSAYGKFYKGTGSVLAYQITNRGHTDGHHLPFALTPPDERSFDSDWSNKLLDQGYAIRYFSGDELCRLFGFRRDFQFPAGTTTIKQQWKLIGNSLNVRVASKIVQLGLLAAGLIGKETKPI
jgi:tRNA (cytosine38-C5)-methyltransferase